MLYIVFLPHKRGYNIKIGDPSSCRHSGLFICLKQTNHGLLQGQNISSKTDISKYFLIPKIYSLDKFHIFLYIFTTVDSNSLYLKGNFLGIENFTLRYHKFESKVEFGISKVYCIRKLAAISVKDTEYHLDSSRPFSPTRTVCRAFCTFFYSRLYISRTLISRSISNDKEKIIVLDTFHFYIIASIDLNY